MRFSPEKNSYPPCWISKNFTFFPRNYTPPPKNQPFFSQFLAYPLENFHYFYSTLWKVPFISSTWSYGFFSRKAKHLKETLMKSAVISNFNHGGSYAGHFYVLTIWSRIYFFIVIIILCNLSYIIIIINSQQT